MHQILTFEKHVLKTQQKLFVLSLPKESVRREFSLVGSFFRMYHPLQCFKGMQKLFANITQLTYTDPVCIDLRSDASDMSTFVTIHYIVGQYTSI